MVLSLAVRSGHTIMSFSYDVLGAAIVFALWRIVDDKSLVFIERAVTEMEADN